MRLILVALCSIGIAGGTEPERPDSSDSGKTSREVEFESPQKYDIGIPPERLAAGDLDGDGDQDVVAACSRGRLLVCYQREGAFEPTQLLPVKAPIAFVALEDVDDDDDLDLVATSSRHRQPRDHVSVVMNEDGRGSFGKRLEYPVGDGPECVVLADLNGDKRKDLAVANVNSAEISILIGDGQGGFLPARTVRLQEDAAPSAIVAADLDRDSDVDLATTMLTDNDTEYGVVVLMNQGMAVFGEPELHETDGGPKDLIAADLDGDGDTDLATANLGEEDGPRYTYDIAVLRNTGRGAFRKSRPYRFNGNGSCHLESVDLELDGDIDLVVTPSETWAQSFLVLLNDGHATFSAGRSFYVGEELRFEDGSIVSDVDGDGDMDVLVPCFGSHAVAVFLNSTRGDSPDG